MLIQFEDKNFKMLDFGRDEKVKTVKGALSKFYRKNDKQAIAFFLELTKGAEYFALYNEDNDKPELLQRLTISELLEGCTH